MHFFTHSSRRRKRAGFRLSIGLAAAQIIIASAAAAPAAGGSGAGETYPAEFFAPYAPQTALDMVSNLPGFRFDAGDQGLRGFSESGGNVLIDGEQPVAKTGGLAAVIAAIPADQVEYIEIIRGGVAAGDAAGRGVVANIVRVKSRRTQLAEAEVSLMKNHAAGRAAFTATRPLGAHELTSHIRFESQGEESSGGRRMFNDTGALIHRDDLIYRSNYPELFGRLALSGPLGAGRMNANLTLARAWLSEGFTFTSPGQADQLPKETDRWRGELSADWTRRIGERYDLELLALTNFFTLDIDERSMTGADRGALQTVSLFETEATSRESIFRARIAKGAGAWRPEFGAEAAWNTLDNGSAWTSFDSDGSPVQSPWSQVRVSELRLEAFAALNWLPSPDWTVAVGAAYETSRIKAESQATHENRFDFLRPRVIVTYKPDERSDLRLALRRTVGQLSFGDFAASADLLAGTAFEGNPDLGPEHKTSLSLEYDRRFGERGALNLSVYHDWRGDVLEAAALPSGAFGVRNVDSARVWGASASVEAPLDALVPGGLVRLRYAWRDSRLTDPVTGEERVINNTHPTDFSAAFRQDLAAARLSWGVEYVRGFRHQLWFADELREQDAGARLGLFIETGRFFNARTRLAVNHVGGTLNAHHRRIHRPDRSGPVVQTEIWNIETPVTVTLSVSRNF